MKFKNRQNYGDASQSHGGGLTSRRHAPIGIQACSFYCALLYCTLQILCFLHIEDPWQPCVERVYRRRFPNSICLLRVPVSHFGNSRNISKLFIIFIFVMMTCDQ